MPGTYRHKILAETVEMDEVWIGVSPTENTIQASIIQAYHNCAEIVGFKY